MEQVLVVNREELMSVAAGAGFMAQNESVLETISNKGFFIDRDKAETDETKKQIIPYCMVTCGRRILLVERKNPGEGRLKGLLAIGIGGHINPEDAGQQILLNAAKRELTEELIFSRNKTPEPVGFLNLDDTPVNRVHFGVVYRIEVTEDVEVIDEGLEGRLENVSDLAPFIEKMEGWSKVLAEKIISGEIKL